MAKAVMTAAKKPTKLKKAAEPKAEKSSAKK